MLAATPNWSTGSESAVKPTVRTRTVTCLSSTSSYQAGSTRPTAMSASAHDGAEPQHEEPKGVHLRSQQRHVAPGLLCLVAVAVHGVTVTTRGRCSRPFP